MVQLRGFSLIELIMVISLVSILAIVITPRLDITSFKEGGFSQQALSAIRYAQKQAIASGCDVDVSITISSCSLNWHNPTADVNCPADNTMISNPGAASTEFCASAEAGSGTDLPANFTFDNIGRPSAGQSLDLGNTTIVVEAETGYSHES